MNKKDSSLRLIDSPCTWFNIRRASRAVTQYFDRALRPSGLKVSQGNILGQLSTQGSVTMGELADELLIDRTTLTRNIQILEKQGLVSIEPGVDRRTRLLEITGAGFNALKTAFPLWREANQQLINEIGHAQWHDLVSSLADLSDFTRAQ